MRLRSETLPPAGGFVGKQLDFRLAFPDRDGKLNSVTTVTPKTLFELLLNIAPVRPIFIWGPPGIGKSSIVEQFAREVGLECVSLLGSQLAPEDLIGVPQIVDGKSRFCPPVSIARDEPYCLFLDELNACSHEVQKAFYSLIHERRIGEYRLPQGSIVIGAGNRAQDSAIVKPLSSALINRMVHVHLRVSFREWMEWAEANKIHSLVLDYIRLRSDHLWTQPPKHEEPFSTPRAWHMVSDALHSYGEQLTDEQLETVSYGCLSPHHAGQFKAFHKQLRSRYQLETILKGDSRWPHKPEDRDLLYFLAQSFRARMLRELPKDRTIITDQQKQFAHLSKGLLKDLAEISFEIAQIVVSSDEQETLPDWFVVEVVRDLPRLVEKRDAPQK